MFDYYKAQIVITVTFVMVLGFVFGSAMRSAKIEKEMIEKCTPDPNQFECQLYLAKKGLQSIQQSAESGALAGGLAGGVIGGSLR